MDVAAWLAQLGLERYEAAFRAAEVTLDVLPDLSEADLERLGLPLGPRKKLLKAAAARCCSTPAAAPAPAIAGRRRAAIAGRRSPAVRAAALRRSAAS
ncbi:MAG: SAM domain-containing protein [Dongiaceae bacterium]